MAQQLHFSDEAKRLNDFISDLEQLGDYIEESQKTMFQENIRKFENFEDVRKVLNSLINEAPVVLKNSKVIVDNATQILGEAEKHNERAKENEANAEKAAQQKIDQTQAECEQAIQAAKDEAQREANQIISDAKAQAKGLVEENNITIQAKAYAEQIVKQAQDEADSYSQKVRGEADAYNKKTMDELNKIVRDYLTRIDQEYKELSATILDHNNRVVKEHDEFVNRFRG